MQNPPEESFEDSQNKPHDQKGTTNDKEIINDLMKQDSHASNPKDVELIDNGSDSSEDK
jgi:hypothetical protein